MFYFLVFNSGNDIHVAYSFKVCWVVANVFVRLLFRLDMAVLTLGAVIK